MTVTRGSAQASPIYKITPRCGRSPRGPRAHLGEGGHGHAVRPLLEGVAALCREGLGAHAVVGRREGDVILVQQIARAAALPLLQAGGTRRAEASAPATPRWDAWAAPAPTEGTPRCGAGGWVMLLPRVHPLAAVAVEDPRVGERKPAPPGRQRQGMKSNPHLFGEDPGVAAALTFLFSRSLRSASRPWPPAPAA